MAPFLIRYNMMILLLAAFYSATWCFPRMDNVAMRPPIRWSSIVRPFNISICWNPVSWIGAGLRLANVFACVRAIWVNYTLAGVTGRTEKWKKKKKNTQILMQCTQIGTRIEFDKKARGRRRPVFFFSLYIHCIIIHNTIHYNFNLPLLRMRMDIAKGTHKWIYCIELW